MSKGALDDIARLKRIRYETKGPGAYRSAPKPSIEKLRGIVAKVTKRRDSKGGRR